MSRLLTHSSSTLPGHVPFSTLCSLLDLLGLRGSCERHLGLDVTKPASSLRSHDFQVVLRIPLGSACTSSSWLHVVGGPGQRGPPRRLPARARQCCRMKRPSLGCASSLSSATPRRLVAEASLMAKPKVKGWGRARSPAKWSRPTPAVWPGTPVRVAGREWYLLNKNLQCHLQEVLKGGSASR